MQAQTFRLKNPIRVRVRDGDVETETAIDIVTFERHAEGEAETNLACVESCARSLVREDGSPATLDELLTMRCEDGLRDAARVALATVEYPA